MDFYLNKLLPIYLIEVLAALVGTYFLLKDRLSNKDKQLVYYLWVVVLVETYGSISALAYISKYEFFGFLKDSFFSQNSWVYHLLFVFQITFFTLYFLYHNKLKTSRLIIKLSLLLYVVISLLLMTDISVLTSKTIPFVTIAGAILLFVTIMFFFLNLLKNDTLLKLSSFLPFYVALGILVFLLCTVPIDITMEYYSFNNEMYMKMKSIVYLYLNLYLYSIYIIGFIVCFKKKSSY